MVNASEAQLEAKASEIEPRSRAIVAIPHIILSSIHPIESIAVRGPNPTATKKSSEMDANL